MRILGIAIVAMLVLAAAALSGIGRPEAAGGASEEPRSGITVTGTGEVAAVPDEAEFSLGITTEGASAREALSENSARMRRLIAALKAAGVADRDLETQDVSVGPSYEGNGTKADRFTASNSVAVRIRKLDRAGAILEAGSQAGANQVYGPSLTREDRDDLEAKALEQAVDDARNRAETLAEAAGVDVGRVTAIVESAEPGVAYADSFRAVDAAASTVPIEKGVHEIQARVTVTFAIE